MRALVLAVAVSACGPVGVVVDAGLEDRGPYDGGGAYLATGTDFKTDGSIGGRYNAATGTLAYSRPNAGGSYKVFLSDVTGAHERALRRPEWGEDRHQFAVDWHPSGKFLFVEVEKPSHPGSSTDAIPGYGAYTDLWAVTPDGARAFKLVD